MSEDEITLTPRYIASMLKSELGVLGAAKVLMRVKKRLKKLPKDQFMSEDEMLKIIEEESRPYIKVV